MSVSSWCQVVHHDRPVCPVRPAALIALDDPETYQARRIGRSPLGAQEGLVAEEIDRTAGMLVREIAGGGEPRVAHVLGEDSLAPVEGRDHVGLPDALGLL